METVRNYWVAKLVTGNDDLLFKRVTARNYAITYAINKFYTLFILNWISKYIYKPAIIEIPKGKGTQFLNKGYKDILKKCCRSNLDFTLFIFILFLGAFCDKP